MNKPDATVDVTDILRRHIKGDRLEITDPQEVEDFWAELNAAWDVEFETLPSDEVVRRVTPVAGILPLLWQRFTTWWNE